MSNGSGNSAGVSQSPSLRDKKSENPVQERQQDLPSLHLTVPEHVVLGRAGGPLQPSVGHEVEVPLQGVADASLDHGTGVHVAGLVLVITEK